MLFCAKIYLSTGGAMVYAGIMSLALVLIIVLRWKFPNSKKSFISSVVFYVLATMLGFQNCTKSTVHYEPVEVPPGSVITD